MAIPQEGRRPHLIFDLEWSGLNADITSQPPKEAMHFGGTQNHVINCILSTDPRLDPVYLIRVYLADAYMCGWDLPEYITCLLFVFLPHLSDTQTLIGLHLSLTMGFVDSAPYL